MSSLVVRQATWLDLLLLLPRIRKADVDECEALFGKNTVSVAACETYRNSQMRYTMEEDGIVIAMFGVAAPSLLSTVGAPWMFGTDQIEAHPRSLMRDGRTYIDAMLRLFPRLENIVDARNTKSIRWLRHLGFTIDPAIPVGVARLPFHPFVMEV